jgi:hypothetical protein
VRLVNFRITWCGYEEREMILLRDLQAAIRLHCSKPMSLQGRYLILNSFHKAKELIKLSHVQMLKGLHEAMRRKRPELGPNDWILHHDNAPAHKALSSGFWPKNRLLKWNTQPIPDLDPNDLWLFPIKHDDYTESYCTAGVPIVAAS